MTASGQRLVKVELELLRLRDEHKALKEALPVATRFVDGRVARRQLSAFEQASAKRIAVLAGKIEALEDESDELMEEIVFELARKRGDGIDDPEVLLRAALVTLTRSHKPAQRSPEVRAVIEALLDYLKSLATDEEIDEA